MADHIYAALRADIVQLKYAPGEKVSEVQLSNKYNVSRAPIREYQEPELFLSARGPPDFIWRKR
jgi:hypothetical protein